LSQTPWVIDGERRIKSSVQEIISENLQVASKAEGNLYSCLIVIITVKSEEVHGLLKQTVAMSKFVICEEITHVLYQ
jgi:hypothetical protein